MSSRPEVLVIDDDPWIRVLVERLLGAKGYTVRGAEDGASALEVLRAGFSGVVVLDIHLPDADGTDLLRGLRTAVPDLPVILLTGQASTDLALDSIRDGASDFVEKSQLAARLPPAVDHAARQLEEAAAPSFGGIVARSPAMHAVFASVRNAVASRVPVLVRGESGTGKELVARALHTHGPRRDGPFVAINCAGIPDTLLETELFGYERGAFTGATARKLGRFDLARQGTLFLDEIGDMPLALQPKLLRVLQEGAFVRLGGVETITADVRVVSATHRELEEAVAAGRFREDLYYRLSVYTVTLPPLRERIGDIPDLARHFVQACAAREGKPVVDIDPRVMELLESYRFPGNVRELENLIAHAVVTSRGAVLGIADLPPNFLRAVALERRRAPASPPPGASLLGVGLGAPPDGYTAPAPPPPELQASPPVADLGLGFPSARPHPAPTEPAPTEPAPTEPAPTEPAPTEPAPFLTLRELQRQHVVDALERAGGNKAEAARLLGVSRMTLYRMLETSDEG